MLRMRRNLGKSLQKIGNVEKQVLCMTGGRPILGSSANHQPMSSKLRTKDNIVVGLAGLCFHSPDAFCRGEREESTCLLKKQCPKKRMPLIYFHGQDSQLEPRFVMLCRKTMAPKTGRRFLSKDTARANGDVAK